MTSFKSLKGAGEREAFGYSESWKSFYGITNKTLIFFDESFENILSLIKKPWSIFGLKNPGIFSKCFYCLHPFGKLSFISCGSAEINIRCKWTSEIFWTQHGTWIEGVVQIKNRICVSLLFHCRCNTVDCLIVEPLYLHLEYLVYSPDRKCIHKKFLCNVL